MKDIGRYALQALFYLPLMAILAVFSRWPPFDVVAKDEALVRLSIAHAAERRHPCRQRTAEELAKMPPNMRAVEDCPRERAPVKIEFEVDGRLVYAAEVPPAGVQKDGLATLYHRMTVPAGEHRVVVRMSDRSPVAAPMSDRSPVAAPGGDRAEAPFNHVREEKLSLAPGDALVIDFNASRGGLEFRR